MLSSILSLSPPRLVLAFNNVHHREQLHRPHNLIGAPANANSISYHARMPRTGLMYDTGVDIDEWDIFAYESLNLAASILPPGSADLWLQVLVISGRMMLGVAMKETKVGARRLG